MFFINMINFPNGKTGNSVGDLMEFVNFDDIGLRPRPVACSTEHIYITGDTPETWILSACAKCAHRVQVWFNNTMMFLFTDKNFHYWTSDRDWIVCSYQKSIFNILSENKAIPWDDINSLPVKPRFQWKTNIDCPLKTFTSQIETN